MRMLSFAMLFLGAVAAQAVENASFETASEPGDAVGWATDDVSGSRWERSSFFHRSGSWSMRLQGTNSREGNWIGLYSTPFAVKAGDCLDYKAWVLANGTSEKYLQAYLEYRSGDGPWQAIAPRAIRPESGRWEGSDWIPMGFAVFAPKGATEARVVVRASVDSEPRVAWYVDDIECRIISFQDYAASMADKERRGDILLLGADTLTQRSLGAYGNDKAPTPQLNALAAGGKVFDEVTAASPWTKPSHASVLTSLYPSQHTVEDIYYALPDEVETLAEVLKEQGYFTAAFVWSAYDGYLGPIMGYDQGFDFYFHASSEDQVRDSLYNFIDANSENLAGLNGGGVFIWYHLWEPHIPYINRHPDLLVSEGQLGTQTTVTGAMIRRIYENEAGYYDDHDVSHIRDVYDWESRQVDQNVGGILDRFRWCGLEEKLNVVLYSDHGEAFSEKPGVWGHSNPYELSVRTPLILRLPGLTKPGTRESRLLASNLDVMPTLAALAGASPNPIWEGRNLLDPDSTGHTAQFGISESRRHGCISVRGNRFKLVVRDASRDPSENANNRDHVWSLFDPETPPIYELYDLLEDPEELTDIAESNPQMLERMKEVLVEHCRRTGIAPSHGGSGIASSEVAISEETERQLEALGYLGGVPDTDPEQRITPVLTDESPENGGGRGLGNLDWVRQ